MTDEVVRGRRSVLEFVHVIAHALAEILAPQEVLEHGKDRAALAVGNAVEGGNDVVVTQDGLPDLAGVDQ